MHGPTFGGTATHHSLDTMLGHKIHGTLRAALDGLPALYRTSQGPRDEAGRPEAGWRQDAPARSEAGEEFLPAGHDIHPLGEPALTDSDKRALIEFLKTL